MESEKVKMQTLSYHQPFDEKGEPSEKLEARTWVLVINYGFENDAKMKRDGNEHDLKLLRETFSNYQNCKFEEVKSPLNTEIPNILGEYGLKERFSPNEEPTPTLFLLFILSHGDENGKIYTDSNPNDFFTTFQVWDALKKNKFLENSLKINFFGPCRGSLKELKVPICDESQISIGKNSTRVLAEPNQKNFISFFSTVESTMSKVETTSGSWMVKSFCKQLKLLEEDVDVTEFLRKICLDINLQKSQEEVQTPQISVFPHEKTLFCKWEGQPFKETTDDVKRHTEHVISAKRIEHFSWKNENNLYYKRGPALIFRQNENNLTKELSEALKVLEFQPQTLDLGTVEATLTNVSQNGLMENEGSLCVAIFGKIKNLGISREDRSGLAVDIGRGAFVPIGDLTRKFTLTECPTFTGKPKVFFIFDPETATDNYSQVSRVPELSQVPPGNNHEGFLVQFCFGKETISKLITELGNPGLRNGKVTLQEVLTEVTRESRNGPSLSQMWSTMSRKLDFPKCKDIYIPHRFNDLENYKRRGFDQIVQTLGSCENDLVFVSAPPGMGKSRASEEIHSQLVVRMNSHFVIHQKLSQTNKYWNTIKTEKRKPTVESFLMNCVDSRKEDYLKSQLNLEKVFLILDGFDEICPSHRKEVLKMIKELINRKVKLLVTSRPQEKYKIINGLKNAEIISFELDEFNIEEQVLMLQTRLNLSMDECKNILDNFYKSIRGFSSNPLHLQMICDLYETERDTMANFNIYKLHEKFLKKKLKHALFTGRQIDENSQFFATEYFRLENALTKSAVLLLVNKKSTSSNIAGNDFVAINMSGVATIVEENGPIDFVHRSYAEHQVAQKILQLCFPADESESDETLKVVDLLCESSAETRMFVEKGISQFSGQDLNPSVKDSLEINWERVLSEIIGEHRLEMFTCLFEKPFGATQVTKWFKISQDKALQWKALVMRSYFDTNRMGLFVVACRDDRMAEKLNDLCISFKVKNVYKAVKSFVNNYEGTFALEILLSKVEGWQKNLLETIEWGDFVTQRYWLDSNEFSSDQLKILFKSEPFAQSLVEYIKSWDSSSVEVSPECLPFLLEQGVDLSEEQNGVTLSNVFLGKHAYSKFLKGAYSLNKFALEVVEHFKKSQDFDCEKSLIYRKNLGAKSPEELGINSFSDTERQKYRKHIDECVLRIFDNGRCFENANSYLIGMYNLQRIEPKLESYQEYSVAFLLHLFRVFHDRTDTKDSSEITGDGEFSSQYLKIVDGIPLDFKFKCGCSLAHTKYARKNVAMMKLLKEKGFSLTEKNKHGQTPLHFKVIHHDCFDYLLQNILNDDFVSLEEDREFPARSEEKQSEIERILCARDNEGKMAIHYAVESGEQRNFELLVKNLLGNLFVSEDGKSAVSTRTEEQQKIVERILLAQDEKGKTLLHSAECIFNLKILLTNLLYSVDEACNWEKQKEIASMLMVKDNFGKSLLDLIEPYHSLFGSTHYLPPFIRNLLRDKFVLMSIIETRKPIDQRLSEEN